jgi:hypothetical protein
VTALVIEVLLIVFVLHGLTLVLRWVRDDQAAMIAEHWRRNGRT